MSIRLFWRRSLLVLAGATALAVAAPAVASAATVTGLTVTPSSEPAATPTSDLTVAYTFSGAPSSLTTHLPAGLIANGTINGGACLITPASNTPPAACQLGTGLINGALPATLYLVAGPHTGDLAGLEILAGGANQGVGDVTSRTTDGGLDITFTGLSGVTSLSTTFNHADLRTPTSCPGENFSAAADSQSTPFAASPAYTTTGCSSLAYHPTMSAKVIKDASDSGAEVISSISQPNAGTESATKSTVLGFGSSLSPNSSAVAVCFVTPCQIGTASATSPLLPSAAFGGATVTLGGTIAAPTLTIHFPVLNLSLVGNINLSNNSVTFPAEPDFPISSLSVDVTGPSSGGKAFTTSCQAATLTGAFTPWDGNAAVHASAPIQYQGCPASVTVGKPVGVAVITGLASGHPKLKFKVKHGTNAPNIKSVSFKAPKGLKLHNKCTKKNGKIACNGLSISGGKVKSVKLRSGTLTITLAKPAGKLTVTAKGPMLTESKALQSKVKNHKTKKLIFTVKVKDAKGTTTTLRLKLKA